MPKRDAFSSRVRAASKRVCSHLIALRPHRFTKTGKQRLYDAAFSCGKAACCDAAYASELSNQMQQVAGSKSHQS
jgi:hypothetical protein